jgi:uncharacterized protein (DUF433 family)
MKPDPRSTPAYPFAEAAHYLNVPLSTLRSWFLGTTYRQAGAKRSFKAVIRLDGSTKDGLSFLNLVEAHVLAGIRRTHGIPLPRVREAIGFVQRKLELERPLIAARFQTDGVDLLVEHLGKLVNASRDGQLEMAGVVRASLRRIVRDPNGVPIKLYPFTRRSRESDSPAPVEIDPNVAFGRPVLIGRAVPTAVLADRFKAGDSLQELADDYDATAVEVEEAIRCELDRPAAA